MSFEQSSDNQFSQSHAFQSENVENTTPYPMQSSLTCSSTPRGLVSLGVLGSSNSGSEAGGRMLLQQPVDWIAAQSSPPEGQLHPDNHELCDHGELFCIHTQDAFGALQNTSSPASNCASPKEDWNNNDIHGNMNHQYIIESRMPAVVAPQVTEPPQPNTTQRRPHHGHHLVVASILNGNGKAQLPPHIQSPSEDRRHLQPNGSPYLQGHKYNQSTNLQSQQHSGATTSVQFDTGMYNM
jgi:hypothetical protein